MILIRPLKENTLTPYERDIRFPLTSPSVYLLSLKKCYYRGVDDVGVYEQMFKARFRLPLSALHRRLFQYLGLAVTQIVPNAWRIFLGAEVLYGVLSKERR